jgi:hypothetical protein
MARVLTEPTYAELLKLIAQRGGAAGERGPRGFPQPVFVRCDSDTAAGSDAIRAECYPATVLAPAADYPTPPEEAGGSVLLTVLGDDGAAGVPTEGAVYLAIITGDVASDASGSGSVGTVGRPRAFAVAAPAAGGSVTGGVTALTSTISASGVGLAFPYSVLSLTLPAPGLYYLSALVSAVLTATLNEDTSSCNLIANVVASDAPTRSAPLCCVVVSDRPHYGSAGIGFVYEAGSGGLGVSLTVSAVTHGLTNITAVNILGDNSGGNGDTTLSYVRLS